MMVTVAMKVPVEPAAPRTPPFIPEACEQQGTESALANTQDPAGALVPENGVEPPDERTVADEGLKTVSLIRPPLLIAEQEKHDHHRRTEDMIVKVCREQAGPAQGANNLVQCGIACSSSCPWLIVQWWQSRLMRCVTGELGVVDTL
jgi:hypothetical protein